MRVSTSAKDRHSGTVVAAGTRTTLTDAGYRSTVVDGESEDHGSGHYDMPRCEILGRGSATRAVAPVALEAGLLRVYVIDVQHRSNRAPKKTSMPTACGSGPALESSTTSRFSPN